MKSVVTVAACAVAGLMMGGCEIKSFLDPSEVGRYQKTTLTKSILTSLSSIDKSIDDPKDEFLNATEARPEDLNIISRDYVIGKSDLVSVSVTDLVGPGVESTKTTRVSESGNISLPLIGQVHAEGVTEAQLEQTIIDSYRNANLIQNAQVSVVVVEARARTFSVLGAVAAPGQYAILQSDFRILDALVLSRDVLQQVETIYLIRQMDQDSAATGPTGAPPSRGGGTGTGGGRIDPLAPRTQSTFAPTKLMLLQTAGGAGAGGGGAGGTAGDDQQLVLPNGQTPAGANPAPGNPSATPPSATPPTVTPPAPPVNPPAPPGAGALTPGGAAPSFQFAAPKPPAEMRVIRIPVAALKNGDLRYNIVVRPRDLILAPNPVIGEYYMGGHVQRVGVYSLSGRRISLKQAIVSAGMLGPLAIPQRTDLIRRLDNDSEVFARVDLDAIFAGTQPDIFLKPYDQVMVGTNIMAPFIAAIRGSFRFTYGFGFLYDRNFAPLQTRPQ